MVRLLQTNRVWGTCKSLLLTLLTIFIIACAAILWAQESNNLLSEDNPISGATSVKSPEFDADELVSALLNSHSYTEAQAKSDKTKILNELANHWVGYNQDGEILYAREYLYPKLKNGEGDGNNADQKISDCLYSNLNLVETEIPGADVKVWVHYDGTGHITSVKPGLAAKCFLPFESSAVPPEIAGEIAQAEILEIKSSSFIRLSASCWILRNRIWYYIC
jgi:hypothetical protein